MIADLVFFPAAIMRFFWALMGLMAAFVACGLLWILWALLAMGNKLNTASAGGVDLNALADAVVAALEATTIPVDAKKMNGSAINGNGTPGDLWRGA